MKMDLNKFKITHSDENTTTLQHPRGHKITIAHNSLNPEHKEMFKAMNAAPKATKLCGGGYMADGGVAENDKNGMEYDPMKDPDLNPNAKKAPIGDKNPNTRPSPTPSGIKMAGGGTPPSPTPKDDVPAPIPTNAAPFVKGFESGATPLADAWKNFKAGFSSDEPQKKADGGEMQGGGGGNTGGPAPAIAPDPLKQYWPTPQEEEASGYPPDPRRAQYIAAKRQAAASTIQNQAQGGEIKQSNPKLEQSRVQPPIPKRHYADGGNASNIQDSPDQIASDAAASAPNNPVSPDSSTPQDSRPFAQQIGAHVGKAVRDAIADTLGAAKSIASPVGDLVKGGVQGLNGQNTAVPTPGLPPSAPGLPQNPQFTAANTVVPTAPTTTPPSSGPNTAQPTSDAASDPMLQAINTEQANYKAGLAQQKAGLLNEAAATGQQGKAEAAALTSTIAGQQQTAQTYQDHYSALEQERQNFMSDIENQHIDPQHYLNSMGTGSKIATGIGLILGGMGGGLSHQGNPALDFLNKQIDRDIQAQQTNLGKSENLLSANLKQFGNLRDATDMTRVMQMDIVGNQMKQAAATAMSPLAAARAQQGIGALQMQSSQILGQMAMRKTLIQGMTSQQNIPPSQMVRKMELSGLMSPEEAKQGMKEASEASMLNASRDNAVKAFDKIAALQTTGNYLSSPIQTSQQIKALKDPVVAGLSKETAGRYTEQDSKALDSIFGRVTSNAKTNALQRQALLDLYAQKHNPGAYATLQSRNINPVTPPPEPPASAAQTQTRNGITYKQVPGGWQKVK
jgi:hypothetical protein